MWCGSNLWSRVHIVSVVIIPCLTRSSLLPARPLASVRFWNSRQASVIHWTWLDHALHATLFLSLSLSLSVCVCVCVCLSLSRQKPAASSVKKLDGRGLELFRQTAANFRQRRYRCPKFQFCPWDPVKWVRESFSLNLFMSGRKFSDMLKWEGGQ